MTLGAAAWFAVVPCMTFPFQLHANNQSVALGRLCSAAMLCGSSAPFRLSDLHL